ncbi:MAG: hypothetical protein AAGC44_05070 [Planctomycetota bacterium]
MTKPDDQPETIDPRDLTLEEILALPQPKPTFPEQNADGVDLSLIRGNLEISVEERIRQSDRFRYEIEGFKKHVKRV